VETARTRTPRKFPHAAAVNSPAATSTPLAAPAEPVLPLDADQPVGDPSSLGKGLLRPRTLISFAIALAILIFFIQRLDLNMAAVVDNIRSANLILLAMAIIVYVGTIVLRAVRWRWMLAVAGAGTLPGTTIPPVGYLTAVLLISWFFVNKEKPMATPHTKAADTSSLKLQNQVVGVLFFENSCANFRAPLIHMKNIGLECDAYL
jgi:hypothetical protein